MNLRCPFKNNLAGVQAQPMITSSGRTTFFIKHGYLPPPQLLSCLKTQAVERVFVCGLQAETCVLAAGFALFDAGLQPTILADMVVGSSLDPCGALGVGLWRHHFGSFVDDHRHLLNNGLKPG